MAPVAASAVNRAPGNILETLLVITTLLLPASRAKKLADKVWQLVMAILLSFKVSPATMVIKAGLARPQGAIAAAVGFPPSKPAPLELTGRPAADGDTVKPVAGLKVLREVVCFLTVALKPLAGFKTATAGAGCPVATFGSSSKAVLVVAAFSARATWLVLPGVSEFATVVLSAKTAALVVGKFVSGSERIAF